MPKNNFASIESIINIAKKGCMFILVDDEKRENEGDLIISTSNSNAKNINFMAKYGRGLICLALDSIQAKRLNLSLMSHCWFKIYLYLVVNKLNLHMNKKFNKQFFWLFAIIGFFLAIFLFVNEYFLNQIATDRFNLEMQMCVELSNECNLDQLANADPSNLNANQLKLIELNTIIENYEQYMIKVAQIFFAFIFIGLIPYLVAWTKLLIQRKKKKN